MKPKILNFFSRQKLGYNLSYFLLGVLVFSACLAVLILAHCALFSLNSVFSSLRTILLGTLTLSGILSFYAAWKIAFQKWIPSLKSFIFQVENLYPDLIGNKVSALLFPAAASRPTSLENQERLEEEISSHLSRISIKSLLPRKALLVAGCLLIVSCLGFLSHSMRLSAIMLLSPSSNPLQLRFVNHKSVYLKGRSIPITLEIQGEPLFPPTVEIYQDSELTSSRTLYQLTRVSPKLFRADAALDGFERDTELKFTSGSVVSKNYFMRVVSPPEIKSQNYTISQPEYLGKDSKTFAFLPAKISQGSSLKHLIQFNKPVQSFQPSGILTEAVIRHPKPEELELIFHTVDQSVTYSLNITDCDNLSLQTSRYNLDVKPDLPPVITILAPSTPHEIKPGNFNKLPLSYKVEDDHLVTEAKLHLKSKQRFEMTWLTTLDELNLTFDPASVIYQTTTATPSRRFYLQEGDKLYWQISAIDNFPGREPSWSTTGIIHVPYQYQLQEEAAAQTEELVDDMQKTLDKQKQVEEKSKELAAAMEHTTEAKLSHSQQNTLKEIAARQEEVQSILKDLEKNMDQQIQSESEKELLSEGTLRKLETMKDLLQKLMMEMNVDTQKWQDMAEQAGKLPPEKLRDMMKQFNAKAYADQIEKNLKTLQKIQARRKLKAGLEKMNHLIKEHEKLSEQIAKNSENSSEVASELKKQWQELKKEMQALAQEKHLGESTIQELREQMLNAEQLEASYEKLESQSSSQMEKMKENQNIQNTLTKMEQKLSEEMKNSEQKQLEINLDEVNRLLAEVLYHSNYLHETTRRLDFFRGQERKSIATSRLAEILASQSNLRQRLMTLYKESLELSSLTIQILDMLKERLKEAISEFENGEITADAGLLPKIASVNNQLGLILFQLKEQLMQQQGAQSMESFLESLEQLSQKQQGLNQKSQGMQSTPMSDAMRQQMMQQMAMQQQLVRESTEQLYQKYKDQVGQAGHLSGISQQMKEVEQRLKQGLNDEQTKKKQQEIEERLLEAMNATKAKKEGKTRKGTTAKNQSIQDGKSGTPVDESRIEVLLKDVHSNLLPEEKKALIMKYFQVLQD
jgi:hypothetical protein